MKKTSIILSILAALLLLVVIWQALNHELIVTGQGIGASEAEDRPQEYAAWVKDIENGQFTGFLYQAQPGEEHAQIVTYTLRLRNPGLLPAEMVEMQLVTEAGDIAAYQTPEQVNVAPGGEETMSLSLLTVSRSSLRRDIVITYYLWGKLYTIRYTLS